jgi:hypothetical protein
MAKRGVHHELCVDIHEARLLPHSISRKSECVKVQCSFGEVHQETGASDFMTGIKSKDVAWSKSK